MSFVVDILAFLPFRLLGYFLRYWANFYSNILVTLTTITLLKFVGPAMPTTIKAALKRWEEATGKKAAEAKEIKLVSML